MRIAFIVNDVDTQIATYTSAHLAFEAARRDHETHYVSADDFTYQDDHRVVARSARLRTGAARDLACVQDYLDAIASDDAIREEVCVSEFDVAFLRNNPSEERRGAGGTGNPAIDFGRQIKRHGVLVLNDPDGLARASSKMYLTAFPESIRPRTLITRSPSRLKEFLRQLPGAGIIKPLNGFGGENVFYIRRGQVSNLNQMISTVRAGGSYVIAQEYLKAATHGDKRLLLLGGEPIRIGTDVAMYKRMRPKDDIRNNMHVGGTRRRAEWTEVEERIATILKPKLVEDGLYFVGVDILGDKVLEINVFSPGGINNINELYGINVGAYVIRDLEKRVDGRKASASVVDPLVLLRT